MEITLGQFTGVVREMRMARRSDGSIAPEIRMDVSRMAAIVGDNFGDKTALKGFVKAMEDFGLTKERLQSMARLVRGYAVKLILRAAMNSKSSSHLYPIAQRLL